MSAPANDQIVRGYSDQYPDNSIYCGGTLEINSNNTLRYTGFLGSTKAIHLRSSDSIFLNSPGCIAAPSITMKALNIILGDEVRGDWSDTPRLYAPTYLSFKAQHITVGHLRIVGLPEDGFLWCKKLTLIKFHEEEPEVFEIIKSWVMEKDTEVEIIRK